MEHQGRSSESESGARARDEVVRLPVPESDLSERLEAMPAPARRARLQPSPEVNLHEEEVEDAIEFTPTDLGMPWDEDEDAGRHETPVGWLGLIGLILIGIVAWAMTSLSSGEERVGERAGLVEANWRKEAESQAKAEQLLARVEEAARTYLAAPSVEEKAKFVRHSARVTPLMKSYYARHDLQPAELENIEEFRPFAIGTRPFIYIAVKVKGGGRRPLSMEQMADGSLAFDWESEVAYQPMSIEEFVEKKPEEAIDLRVYARYDNFYNYEFTDHERYRALLITERDSEHFLFGYVVRGTELDDRLAEILPPATTESTPMMVRVRFLPGTRARRSVLIEELVSPRWIYADDPSQPEPDPGE